MRYIRKPIEIDALAWNGYDGVLEVIEEWAHPAPVDRQENDSLAIHTLEHGTKVAAIGDYVCRYIAEGGVFVVKPEGFKLMYVPINEEDGA